MAFAMSLLVSVLSEMALCSFVPGATAWQIIMVGLIVMFSFGIVTKGWQ